MAAPLRAGRVALASLFFLICVAAGGLYVSQVSQPETPGTGSPTSGPIAQAPSIQAIPRDQWKLPVREPKAKVPALMRGGLGAKIDVAVVADASGPAPSTSGASSFASACSSGSTSSTSCNDARERNLQTTMLFNRGGIGTQAFYGPSDAHGAATIDYRIALSNGTVRIDSTSFGIYEKTLRDFWTDNSNGNALSLATTALVFDPVGHFDKVNKRWIVAALLLDSGSAQQSKILLAVSQANAPTAWKKYSLDVTSGALWLDRIEMVANSNSIGITGNYFLFPGKQGLASSNTTPAAAFFFDKATLYSGTASFYRLPLPTYGIMLANDAGTTNTDFLGASSAPVSSTDPTDVSTVYRFSKSGATWSVETLSQTGFAWQHTHNAVPYPGFGPSNVKLDSRVLQCARGPAVLYCVQHARIEKSTSAPILVQAVWTQWSERGTALQWGYVAPTAPDLGRNYAGGSQFNSVLTVPTFVPALALDSQGVMAISYRASETCNISGADCGLVLAGAWRNPSTPVGTLHYSDDVLAYPRIGRGSFETPFWSGDYASCDPATGLAGTYRFAYDSDSYDRAGDYGLLVNIGDGSFQALQGATMDIDAGSIKLPTSNSNCKVRDIFITKWYEVLPNRYVDYRAQQKFPATGPTNLVLAATAAAGGTFSYRVTNNSTQPAPFVTVIASAGSGVTFVSGTLGGIACSVFGSDATCRVPGLDANGVAELNLVVKSTSTSSSTLRLEVMSTNGDTANADNIATATVAASVSGSGGTGTTGATGAGGATSSSSSGGGGCTIANVDHPHKDISLALMVLISAIMIWRRSFRRLGD